MDRYRKMFDQAVKQLGPERDRVDALRTELARRCPDGQEKEVVPMKKRAEYIPQYSPSRNMAQGIKSSVAK